MSSAVILAERADQARVHYRDCLLCEHRCRVDRMAGARGKCKAGAEARVFRHRVEYGEELELVPSHLFYLSVATCAVPSALLKPMRSTREAANR